MWVVGGRGGGRSITRMRFCSTSHRVGDAGEERVVLVVVVSVVGRVHGRMQQQPEVLQQGDAREDRQPVVLQLP
eukprot:SAG22_NODE_161_length_16908_cov_39.687965_20_plen_74_part_00